MHLVPKSKSSRLKFETLTKKNNFHDQITSIFQQVKSHFVPQFISWKLAFRWLFTWPSLKSKTITITTKNRTKKSFVQKLIVRSIPIFPANVATFEENLLVCASFWTFWTPITQKLKIEKILIWFIFRFSKLRMCWPLLRGRVEVYAYP